MSMSYFGNRGYGFEVKTLPERDPLLRLLDRAPKTKVLVKEFLDGYMGDDYSTDNLLEDQLEGYEDDEADVDNGDGCVVIAQCLREISGFDFRAHTRDEMGSYPAIMFDYGAPWEYNDKEKNLTAQDIRDVLWYECKAMFPDLSMNDFMDMSAVSYG